MNKKAVVLFSGGLDSILAAKLMLEQGIEVIAVNFSAKLCMCGSKTTGESRAETAAKTLGIALKTIDITDDFIDIVKNPRYGHGANMNPCIDCKIYMLRRAKEMMAECGASFLVTGEVLGERPMSQRMDALNLIDKRAGVKGLLLRPLTAKNMEPTLSELEGIVDRKRLLDIKGKSRRPQMALARELGITEYPNPAGGCLLTDPGFAKRVKDAIRHSEFTADNLAILSVGRHFRLSDGAKLIVGRDEAENDILLSLARPDDLILELKSFEGPTSILRGKTDDDLIKLSAAIAAYHTKFRRDSSVEVDCRAGNGIFKNTVSVKPAVREEVESLRL